MKKQYNALKKLVFGLVLLFAGVQGVFAALTCEGTVYLKLPSGWTTAYAAAGGQFTAFKKSTTYPEWVQISTADIGGINNADEFFISSKRDDYGQYPAITPKVITESGEQVEFKTGTGFTCRQFGSEGELWIEPNPGNPSLPLVGTAAADVKYFYIFLPNNAVWKSSIPMMSVDGKPGEAMAAVPDRCGWFYKRYIDEEPPSSVLIYRDDDEEMKEAIGMEGDWGEEGATTTPIDLKMLFEFFATDPNFDGGIYFVAAGEFADESNPDALGWTVADPVGVTGDCGYELAALIYDTDASLHGAFTCAPTWTEAIDGTDAVNYNACHYSSAKFPVVANGTTVVPCIGVTTGMVTDELGTDKKPALTAVGKKCFGNDAENAFHAMFNYTEGVNENYCFNMPFSQTDDGKYEFDSDNFQSPGAKVPGGFYPAEKTPEASMFIPNTNPLPAAESKRRAEGPIFFCADYNGKSGTPEGLRTIDASEGVPKSDLMCKGPGWDGGIDCEGLFMGGAEFNQAPTSGQISRALGVSWEGDGWGWSCPNMAPVGWQFYNDGTEIKTATLTVKNQQPKGGPRWTSGDSESDILTGEGRNQHFCFESHASFRYKKGLRFSFRGDDDIWVYIDNKLAVDLGGTHLAAPGYVDLDKFVGKSGVWKVGETYDIDIFFCDRRTTMSNVRIKTNMFIQQTSGLKKNIISKAGGEETYELEYRITGDGSCGGGGGTESAQSYKGADLCSFLESKGKVIDYYITNKKGDKVIKEKDEMAQSMVYFGGIDLTNRCDPKIIKTAFNTLTPNTYYLVASVDGKTEKFQFKVTGNLDIVTKPGQAQDEDGNLLPGTYEFTSLALASTQDNPSRIPLYISSLMDQGETLLLDIGTAVGQGYTLEVKDAAGAASSDVTLEYFDAASGKFVSWDGKSQRYIGDGGVDTIYASIPMAMLNQSEQTYNILVGGHATGAKVTFFAPKMVFVEDSTSTVPVTGDDGTSERWTGSVYNFYLLALAPSLTNPGQYEPCGERCNFNLTAGSGTSTGLMVDSAGLHLVNGRTMITMYSTKEYRMAGNGVAASPATLSIVGPSVLIKADYSPLFFRNPPVPFPVFADMFDVRGNKPALQMLIDDPYFSMEQEYLDGIADSLVIYYNREFYNNPDSLPGRIVVYWDGEEDSVVVTKEFFKTVCAAEANLPDTLCLPRISISGVQFSKEVRTASPNAKLESYATFMDRGKKVEEHFSGSINDRVAPIIKTASVYSLSGGEMNKMTIELSEEVKAPDQLTKEAFTVWLNSANALTGAEKFVVGMTSPSALAVAGDKVTINFPSSSDVGLSPHTGDYVRFRADVPLWTDVATPVLGTDPTLRPADDADYLWNYPTDYNSTKRLPSPWAAVTGEAETGVKSINYTEVSTKDIPKNITTVKGYPVTDDFEAVKKDNPGVLGYFIQSDIYSLIYSDSNMVKHFTDPANQAELANIYLEFELDVFTNLGGFVAHESKKVFCTDSTVFGAGNSCLDTQRNFFISWNTIASDGRLVGTGAYISKMKSSVHLSKRGTRAKMDKTKLWGVRRDKGFKGHVVNE